LELFLDTNNDEFNFFHVAFNAAGTRFDQRGAGDNNAGANVFGANYAKQKVRDTDWNGEWTVGTSRHDDRWEAELVLPFRTFGRASDLWGLNVCRNRKAAEAETSAWRAYGFFQQPNKFGKLLLSGPRNGHSTITQINLPLNRFGSNIAEIGLSDDRGSAGHAEVLNTAGQAQRFDGGAAEGGIRLPYVLEESAAAITYVVEENGAVSHRLRMPVAVPSPLGLVRAQKVLSTDAPRGTLQWALRISEQERTARRFRATLIGPGGKAVDQVEAALGGDSCTLALDLGTCPQGLYNLTLELIGPPGEASIQQREAVVLVPPFISGKE
jgi:hypothetical protein